MQYEFEDEQGGRHEVSFPMGKAPGIGRWIRRGGRRLRRVPSVGARPMVEPNRQFICFSQHPDEVASPHRTKVDGVEFAVVTSKRQIQETEGRSGGQIRYGDGMGRVRGTTNWT